MDKTNIVPFAFDDVLVRVHADENGEPLFVAKDVAGALEYNWNGSACIAHLPDEWKMVRSVLTISGEKDTWFLSEQGLYFFLARSDKPKALPFQKWLAGEVLPAIRKTGVYSLRSAPPPNFDLDDTAFISDCVKRLRPVQRERALFYAIQSARITNVTTQAEIDALFLRYCVMLAAEREVGNAILPGVNHTRQEEFANIRRFIGENLEDCRGNRISAGDLYFAFRAWWKGRFDAAPPSQKRFGHILADEYVKLRRGGNYWYLDVAFKEQTP